MNHDRNRDPDLPNRQSNKEQEKGSHGNSSKRRRGFDTERNRMDSEPPRTSNSGGITNRPLDRENCEQDRLPERGQSQSER